LHKLCCMPVPRVVMYDFALRGMKFVNVFFKTY